MGLFDGIIRATGAIVGGLYGGPAGAALGGAAATKLTGGSTKDALVTGAISGLGAWGMGQLSGGGGAGGVPVDYASEGIVGNAPAAEVYGPPAPSMWDRASDFVSDKSNLTKLGLGGLMAAGAMSGGRGQQQPSYVPAPAGSEVSVRQRPLNRSLRSYGNDPYRYGETGGEFRHFDDVNPRAQYYRRGGRVGIGRYAAGGRTFSQYTGNPYSYGAGGEHLYFNNAPAVNTVPGSPAPMPSGPMPGADSQGMFRFSPQGEMGGGTADTGDTGTAVSNSFGDFISAALSGLAAISGPIGLTVGMLGAKEGKLGTPMDAVDTLTGYGKTQAEVVDGRQGMQSSNDANANGEAATSGDSAMGGHGGNSNGMGGSDPDGNGNWKRGGHVRGLGDLGAPMQRRGGALRGPGGGQDDLIPAYVADGEHILDADIVAAIGDGSNDEGHRKIEDMKRKIRTQKRKAPVSGIPPKTKGLGSYLSKAA